MKKVLVLVLCMLLCMSMFLVGCSKEETVENLEKLAGKTPEELYDAAVEALKSADGFEAVSTQKIVMSAQGQKMTMNQEVLSKQNGYDMYFKSENDMAPTAEMEVTYVDGVYYLVQNGKKVKKEISHEEMDQLVSQIYGSGSVADQTLLNIPESWFEDISFEKDGSSYTLTFIVAAEKYTEMVSNAGLPGATFTSDVEYVVYFDADGNLEKTVATFSFEVSGVKCDAVSTSIITIGNVEITAPADADSYSPAN